MNGLEASRVIAVMDEALDGLKFMSYITPEMLDTAEQLADLLTPELANQLVSHRAAVASLKGQVLNDAMQRSSAALWRQSNRTAGLEAKLRTLPVERAPAMMQLIRTFQKMREQVHKRLTTTVEEDKSNQEYYEEVREREDKALQERQQLEQKLKLERIERQKQMRLVTEAEMRAKSELSSIQTSHRGQMESIHQEAELQKHSDLEAYKERHSSISKELDAARKQLDKLQEDNRDLEAALHKAKKKAEQDVEQAILEYDKEMDAKEGDYQAELQIYEEMQKQLTDLEDNCQQMQQGRVEHERQQRLIAEAKRLQAELGRRQEKAAKTIQAAWRSFQQSKEASKKAGKKGKKGKKK